MKQGHFTDYSSGIVGVSLLAGITIAWAVMLMPAHGTFVAAAGNRQAVFRSASNLTLKGDRLIGTTLRDKVEARRAPTTKRAAKLPVGCDPAFSKTLQYES